MIEVIYYIDANEGRTYDEPQRPNVTQKITFAEQAAYDAWAKEHPECSIVSEERSGKAAASRLNSLFGGGK